MSNIKISELTEAAEANENDLLMIIQNGENKKIKASKVGTGQAGGGGDTLPIGAILPFSSDTIPNGWLLCDGRIVEQADYPELFEVIGTTYGYYSRTDFKLPDLRGRVAVGKNTVIDTETPDTDFNELGKTGGEKTHTLTVNEMPSHNHDTSNSVGGGSGNISGFMWSTTLADWGKQKTTATGGGQPHNNLQPYLVTNFIIKAKMTVAIEGEIIQEDGTASETNVYSASAMDNKLKTNIVTGEEVATNDYVDGKQIFRKRVDVGNLPNASEKLVPIGLTNVNIVKFSGYYFSSSEGFGVEINHGTGTNYYVQTYLRTNTMQIDIACGTDRSSYTGYVDIYYTKK